MTIPQDQITKYDVIFLPVDYNSNSTPKVQYAMDDHLGNNRFFISLSLRRAEFIEAYEMEEYDKCETIATDIVTTVIQEYGGRFLEGASTSADSTFTDLGHGCEAFERVKFALHSLPQNSFSVDIMENVDNRIEDEENEEAAAAFVKDALSQPVSTDIFDDNDIDDSNYQELHSHPQSETNSSFESIYLYNAFGKRLECFETNSISSVESTVESNTVSIMSMSCPTGKQNSISDSAYDSEYETSPIVQSLSLKDSTMDKISPKKESESTAAITTLEDSTTEIPTKKTKTTTKKARKKRVIQRKGLLKFNDLQPASKPKSKQRSNSKVNVNLGDSRFAIDPSLSEMVDKAASEGQGTDITDLYTTNSYCDSTASEPKRQKVLAPVRGLRSMWLKKFNVGKSNSKHYSASEVDIIESDKKVKCLNKNAYRDLSSYDVLCQTQPSYGVIVESTHLGNSRLKVMMQNRRDQYHFSNATSSDKKCIINNLVSEVVDGIKGKGNFVAKQSEERSWYELDQQMACSMVESSLGDCEHDSSILDLPDSSVPYSSDVPNYEPKQELTPQVNFMGCRHNQALMNLKNRKKKRILSSNMNLKSIADLQKQMLETTD